MAGGFEAHGINPLTLGARLRYRVQAQPPRVPHENPMHSEGARRLGFPEGLVVGVTGYGWMTHLAAAALGRDWLDRGSFSVTFLRPFHYGQQATLAAEVDVHTGSQTRLVCRAFTATHGDNPVALATMAVERDREPPTIDLADYRAAPLPEMADRPIATLKNFPPGKSLGSIEVKLDRALVDAHLEVLGESLSIYKGQDAPIFPGLYLSMCNWAFELNYLAIPWMHLKSAGQHLGPSRVGDELAVRGVVHKTFEEGGRRQVQLDLVIVANGKRPVAKVRHTVAYELYETTAASEGR
ncbi:MAG: hypothetical protein HY903_14320 [Deltaproteobacteria bacterium]|nr:hypothetical protein [Deltaproteobacteria bacterium]